MSQALSIFPHRVPIIGPRKAWAKGGGFPDIFLPKLLIPFMPFGGQCDPLVETVFPDSDVSDQDFASTPLWQKLDNNSDSDTITYAGNFLEPLGQAECSSTTDNVGFEVGLVNPSRAPASSRCQGMRWRFRFRKVDAGGPPSAGTIDLNDLRLKEGGTTRDVYDYGVVGTSYVTHTVTLTDGEVDSIVDHSDLRLSLDSDTCAADEITGGPLLEVAWCELEYYAK